MFLVGSANGFVEIGINPADRDHLPQGKDPHAQRPPRLVAGRAVYRGFSGVDRDQQGHGLAGRRHRDTCRRDGAKTVDHAKTLLGWQIKAALVFIPTLIYGALFLFEKFPVTERVEAGISSKAMYAEALRPMFLLWAVCMLMTASVELGPQQWQNSVLTKTSKISGTWILMYTSFMMFLLRHFAGPIAHRLSPVGMLTGSAVLTAIGLYLLSFADSTLTAFTYATIYGLGIVYFWPTMLGVTAERFPKGGAFLLGLMGCVGNLAVAAILPLMGSIYDDGTLAALPGDVRPLVVVSGEKLDADKLQELGKTQPAIVNAAEIAGARQAFRKVSAIPIVLFFIFAAIAISDRLKGATSRKSYRAKSKEFTAAELASDF